MTIVVSWILSNGIVVRVSKIQSLSASLQVWSSLSVSLYIFIFLFIVHIYIYLSIYYIYLSIYILGCHFIYSRLKHVLYTANTVRFRILVTVVFIIIHCIVCSGVCLWCVCGVFV